ncbi:MAG: peptidase M23 [Bacteroidetes bacterium CG2_30_32_10]|nr:MAG: peptidase M23 [Bacteroidetes bacterium CG2_30_32_10]
MLKEKRNKLYQKLKNKYRLVLMNDETFEERLSFRLSRLNVFVVVGTITILLIIGTTFIIAFTPLREYIPGYSDVNSGKRVVQLLVRVDSLESALNQNNQFLRNINNVMDGKVAGSENLVKPTENMTNYDTITISKSKEDSALRTEIESQNQYNIGLYNEDKPQNSIKNFYFFTPLKGTISNNYSLKEQHYGIDIVASPNDAIKATLDGIVILAAWTLETGYVIAIQHQSNLISVYKHNSVLLKKEGMFVKAGEPIAYVGNSGELTSGPHLHFELWYNGNPVDPKEYISF